MDVNQKQLADILGLTDRRIRQLKNDYGLFEKGMTSGKSRKNYCLEKCIPEYIEFKVNSEMNRGTDLVKERQQAEHEEIKKKISMLKLKRMKRELHAADDVELFLTNMLVDFKNRLLSMPQKVAQLVIGETDINVIVETMEKEVFQALNELSEYDPEKIDNEKLYDDDDDEEDE